MKSVKHSIESVIPRETRISILKEKAIKVFGILEKESDEKIDYGVFFYIESHCRANPQDIDNIVTDYTLMNLLNRKVKEMKNPIFMLINGLFAEPCSLLKLHARVSISELSIYYNDYLRYTYFRKKRNIPSKETKFELELVDLAKLFIELYCPEKILKDPLLPELILKEEPKSKNK